MTWTRVIPMTRAQAHTYLQWVYPEPYTFYNTPPSAYPESLDEIFAPNGMDYFSVLDAGDALFGIFEYSFAQGWMELGLGIRPEDTSKGLGAAFVGECIRFGRAWYGFDGPLFLRVADFNARAIGLYQKLGFVTARREPALCFGAPVTFLRMELT